jgi:hypothetical protein
LLRSDGTQRSLAVVAINGDSICRFNHCVFTLDNADDSTVNLEVVSLLDSQNPPKIAAKESKSRAVVRFSNSFVRGKGNLVGVNGNRPFDLRLEAALVCLSGSLLDIHFLPGGDALSADAQAYVHLEDSTFYLAAPALRMHTANRNRGLIYTQVSAANCLFGAAAVKPLVRVEGLDSENQLTKVLNWGDAANAFAGYEKFLEMGAATGDPTLVYQSEEWTRFTGFDPDTRIERMAVQPGGGAGRGFVQFLPADFALKTDLANYGVQVEFLPNPTVDVIGQWRW